MIRIVQFCRALWGVASKRPAETTASTASLVAAGIVTLFGLHAAVVVPLALVLGHLPAIITFFVERSRARSANSVPVVETPPADGGTPA